MSVQGFREPQAIPATGRRGGIVAVLVAFLLLIVGIGWAKWLPYTDKARALHLTHTWDGSSLLGSSTSPSWSAAWTFARAYTTAVWRALLVSLLIAAAVDALVPRRWLLRAAPGWAMAPSDRRRARVAAHLMCTCCAAPLVVTLRRSGVPVPKALAHWLGNPLLNPAVVVFLSLVTPWQWAASPGWSSERCSWSASRRSSSRPCGPSRRRRSSRDARAPDGWRDTAPVLLGLATLGASTGLLGVLLITLPAVSLPSLVMVGRALSFRAAILAVGGVLGAGLVAAAVLTALS